MSLIYRIEELLARLPDRLEAKRNLRKAMGISANRLNSICRATWQEPTSVQPEHLAKAAAFFHCEIGDLYFPYPTEIAA